MIKYKKQISNLKNILEKIKSKNERKSGSKDLMDTIDFILGNLENTISIEYPTYIDFDADRIRFNFWTVYPELPESDMYCNNDVIISKKLDNLSIKSNYGKINFYENYDMKTEKVEKQEELPEELVNGDENSLYELNPDTKERIPNKEESVITYYVLCSKLKDLIRTGWKDWKVSRDRIESVAEHIYKTQQLALAMNYTYHYNIDIFKVIMMISIHETEEIIIGDLTQFQISKEEKISLGHKAVHKIFSSVLPSVVLESLIYEFDEGKTKEARFAYECDKLECDLQARLYDLEKCVDVNNQEGNKTAEDPIVQALLSKGMSFSEMWMTFDQGKCNFDKNFMNVSNYAKTHNIDSYKAVIK